MTLYKWWQCIEIVKKIQTAEGQLLLLVLLVSQLCTKFLLIDQVMLSDSMIAGRHHHQKLSREM